MIWLTETESSPLQKKQINFLMNFLELFQNQKYVLVSYVFQMSSIYFRRYKIKF